MTMVMMARAPQGIPGMALTSILSLEQNTSMRQVENVKNESRPTMILNKIIAATLLGHPQPEEKTSITRLYGVDLPGFKPIVKFA